MSKSLSALIPPLLALLLFSYTLDLPPFLDDGNLHLMIHDFQNVGTHGTRFWAGSASYQYYRPMGFTLMELAYGADGTWDVFGLHLFNVLIYALTAAGIGVLTQRLTRSTWAGVLGGCAFVFYPYTFRSVTWIAANFHLMVAAGLTFTLLFGLMWLDRRRGWPPLVMAWGAAFFGLFSQELGVLVAPLTVLLALTAHGWGVIRTRRFWVLVIPLGMLTAFFLYRYVTVPRPAAGPLTFYFDQSLTSLAVMSQGLAYPFFTVVRRFITDVPQTFPMLALSAGVVALGAFMAGRRWRVALFGAATFGALALPVIILTPTDYVKGSVHVMTTAAIGMGIFWGAALHGGLTTRRRWLRGLTVVIIIGGVFVSLMYNAARKREALLQAEFTYQVFEMTRDDPRQVVLINAPSFLGAYPQDRWLLTGSEATMMMEGSYANYNLIFRAMTGRDFPRYPAFIYQPAFQRPPTIEYAPMSTHIPLDFERRVQEARTLIVTVMVGDLFIPVKLPGKAWPIFREKMGWE